MALTDALIKAAKPQEKLYELIDERGLTLEVTPQGAKRWRFRFQLNGKRNRLSLGHYPEVRLKDARMRRDEMRILIANGIDPALERATQREAEKGVNQFETIAREWFTKFSANWTKGHAATVLARLEQNVFPFIGKEPINELTAPAILQTIQRVEARGALETAHRIRQICSQVFRYAITIGKADRDPAADIRGALPPVAVRHHPSITDPKAIAQLLKAIDAFSGTHTVRCALRFIPLVFVRSGELREAEWTEFNFDAAEWLIPAHRMKMLVQHIVPLSRQAIAILKDVQPLTGSGRYVFPSLRTYTRPISENTINASLRRLGYSKEEMTCHGFRSMASTLLNEHGWNRDAIERQLAHTESNSVRAAYNYAEILPERRKMMQWWADYLDSLRSEKS
jgi:integrase